MNEKPSSFTRSLLTADHRKNRNWQEAMDSPFSDFMDRMSLSTRLLLGFVGLLTLSLLAWGAKQGYNQVKYHQQKNLALQFEAISSNIEKILSDDPSKRAATLEGKALNLKIEKEKLAKLAKNNPKNIYGYEAAQHLAKLAVDEAIKHYDARVSEPATAQELKLHRAPNLKPFSTEMRRTYAIASHSAEHQAYIQAINWLKWSIQQSPDEITRFFAQKKLARLLWAIGKFEEAFALLDTMSITGDCGTQVHRLRGTFLELQGQPLEALKEYESALTLLDKNIKLLGESGLPESSQEVLDITRTVLEQRIAALKAVKKVEGVKPQGMQLLSEPPSEVALDEPLLTESAVANQ